MEAIWRTLEIFLVIHTLLLPGSDAMTCPPNASCCACVSSPGCSWYTPPESGARGGYCAQSPYLQGVDASGAPLWARQAGSSHVTPSQPSVLTVVQDEPFHDTRGRRIRPQRATVDLAVGFRHEVYFQVAARASRFRLQVRGPREIASGAVEFNLRRADGESCVAGLTEVHRRRGSRGGRPGGRQQRRSVQRATASATSGNSHVATRPHRRQFVRSTARRGRQSMRSTARRGRQSMRSTARRDRQSVRPTARRGSTDFPRRKVYACRGAGPGLVHNLHLALDVKRCLPSPVVLRVVYRDSDRRSLLRVTVNSQCTCAACSAGEGSAHNGTSSVARHPGEGHLDGVATNSTASAPTSPPCQDATAVVQCDAGRLFATMSPWARLCQRRGVNDVCVPDIREVNSTGSTGFARACSGRGNCLCGECLCSARHELFPSGRYTGAQCECDDYSCPDSYGAMCGSPTRGRCACGQCACSPGYVGDACEVIEGSDYCVNPEDGVVCGGRGECFDGQCMCPWPYTGQFCECDSQACPRDGGGELCGGARGSCLCGVCACQPGYSGPACQVESGRAGFEAQGWTSGPPAACLENIEGGGGGANVASTAGVGGGGGASLASTASGVAGGGSVGERDGTTWGLVCSGRGLCLNGACVCSAPFSGSLCQHCPSCDN